MKYFTIPLDQQTPWYAFTIELSGQRFGIEARYNPRMDRWILNISDAAGAIILAGVPLLLRRVLLVQYPTLPLPAGVLYVDAISGDPNAQPGAGSFLTTHYLYYGEYET